MLQINSVQPVAELKLTKKFPLLESMLCWVYKTESLTKERKVMTKSLSNGRDSHPWNFYPDETFLFCSTHPFSTEPIESLCSVGVKTWNRSGRIGPHPVRCLMDLLSMPVGA